MGAYTSFILCLISCLITFYSGVCSVSVNNGAYEDINIVIQDSVTENDVLLRRIQKIFADASQLLFYATKRHVFFGKINIILPKTWSIKPEYTVIAARSELDSYITVEESTKKRPPHTKFKRHKCGEQGHYIYLPTRFLLTEGNTEWGHHASVLVHEWAHYRWGLYDEYITNENGRFYMDAGEWKQSRCSEQIKGKVGEGTECDNGKKNCNTRDTSKKIDKNCKFCPDESQNDNGSGSIMAYNWVNGVTMFCDDPDDDSVPKQQKHNRNSISKQNLKCNHRSAWEVMRDHDDFKLGAQLPASTNTTPEFQILQESVCYRVFVLDVSGSMAGSRIDTLYTTSKYIIETFIPDGSFLGIVWFQSIATITKQLTQITSDAIRNDLIANLPTAAGGSTCIGCGIEAALSMQPGNQPGIEIILISDGENNVGDLDASIQKAVDAKVTIHTIAVSQAADTRLSRMATRTGGRLFSYLEGNITFASIFLEVVPCGMTAYARESITVYSGKLNTSPSTEASMIFDIDSSIGNNTAVSVLLDTSAAIDLEVSGPDGVITTATANGKSAVLFLPGVAVAGHYKAKVNSSSQANFECYVTSLANEPEVIRVSSQVSPTTFDSLIGELPVIIADVMKGRAPVLGVDATAVVEDGFRFCNLSLLDNGADPDDFADDGIYTAVIPRECLRNGRLSTQIYVRGESGIANVLYGLSGAGSAESDEDSNNTEVLQNSFQRVIVSNKISITNVLDQDIVAPGRITDMDIVDIVTQNTQHGENRTFTITWTATGNDVSIGLAMEYEVIISDDLSLLSNNFASAELADVVKTNFAPKAAGETETIRIEVEAEQSYLFTLYIAVRVKDDAGNIGPVSNIVSIVVANGYRIQVGANGTIIYSGTVESTEKSAVEVERTKNLLSPAVGLAVGLSSGAAVIVVGIIIFACCVLKLRTKQMVGDYDFNTRFSKPTVLSIDNYGEEGIQNYRFPGSIQVEVEIPKMPPTIN